MKKGVKNVTVADILNVDMTIYTRTGDGGTSVTYGGKRFSKSSPQFEAEGTLDELSSFIGLITNKKIDSDDKKLLAQIQKDLYLIMAYISGKKDTIKNIDDKVKKFEQEIDAIQTKLPKLNQFIVPDGTKTAAWFHILRTVCRRSERSVVRYFETLEIGNCELKILSYLNRLSDLFFVLARKYSQGKEKTL
jgi:cob(I)alamin adenosyltransferase